MSYGRIMTLVVAAPQNPNKQTTPVPGPSAAVPGPVQPAAAALAGGSGSAVGAETPSSLGVSGLSDGRVPPAAPHSRTG